MGDHTLLEAGTGVGWVGGGEAERKGEEEREGSMVDM